MSSMNEVTRTSRIPIRILCSLLVVIMMSAAHAAETPGFYVKGRYLYDYYGQKVVLRGINDMVTWTSRDGRTMPEMAKTGANCVRIVALVTDKPADLDKWITLCYQNKMIPMPELHNATGNWSNLGSLFNYWTRSDVVSILKKHEKYLLLNIGNEVGDASVTATQWVNDYGAGIKRLREAGINACLVVDATDWGKKIDDIISSGQSLLAQDPNKNVLFSAHAYWPLAWGWSDQKVKDKLQAAVDQDLAFIIGEFGNQWDQTASGAIPYKTILEECQRLEVGWLAWSWGPGNNPQKWLDMTSNGTFAGLRDWGLEVAITLPTSIKNTSIRPPSITGDPIGVIPQESNKAALRHASARPKASLIGSSLTLTVRATGAMTVELFDMQGRCVRRLYQGILEKGLHRFPVDSRALTRGVYAVRCSAEEWVSVTELPVIR